MISGNLRTADELGRQCLELAHASGDPDLLIEAHHQLWATKFYAGDYGAAEIHLDFGIATYDPDQHHRLTYIYTGHDPGICCRNFSANLLWLQGYPDQALERCRETVALAERLSHPLTLAQAQSSFSYIHLMRREPGEARRWVEKWGALSREFVLSLLMSQARFQLGWALADQGFVEEGVSEMREGIAATTATGEIHHARIPLCPRAGLRRVWRGERGAGDIGAGICDRRRVGLELSATRAAARQG